MVNGGIRVVGKAKDEGLVSEEASAIAGMEFIRVVLVVAASILSPFALYALWETGVVKERRISPLHMELEGKDRDARGR